ncbi:Mth938-like domain-containing protein [Polynucleobacter kasalickyi]|uniref:Uncharacterized conserved protein, contains Mth938-like domain n=1 Tax=Polynucleobacter kasalickyi TaxID=1938817 RepID=A0A1W1Y799_9BURK|nr:Mth938-like domain-containing protein [Polynucleobacter kasalickyi]SMC32042.1 Uncharacterized conserved protein, contains Mth938-like domain [Polynucleobacter kasalickyi]
MKLQPDPLSALNTVTRIEDSYIEINTVRYESSILVMPEGAITPWNITNFNLLERSHFELITELRPELVILGSGLKHRFVSPNLMQDLYKAKIGFEAMTTQAACRTYNILMGEGRLVLGAFLIETTPVVAN